MVSDALDSRPRKCRSDLDLLDILDDLQKEPAVLVVDQVPGGPEVLRGILTAYDTTEYFRLRAQDTMIAQDIEEMLKGFILAAFRDASGGTQETELREAIRVVTSGSDKAARAHFMRSLQTYATETGTSVDKGLALKAFDSHAEKEVPRFDLLSLADYIQLFTHSSTWQRLGEAFRLDRDAIRRLLDRIRATRNDLAHLRYDISAQQREELRFCKDWLGRHSNVESALAVPPVAATSIPDVAESPDIAAPVDEAAQPSESRYADLASWLQKVPVGRVVLTFAEIEEIIGDTLPPSAREHRAWWANDNKSHVQSRLWLHAGWQVESVKLQAESVIFARSGERELAYRSFFEKLLEKLRRVGVVGDQVTAPRTSWLTVLPIPDVRPRVAYLNVAFTRSREFRIEIYIDSGDKLRNKEIFDTLFDARDEIALGIGVNLTWERIDDKRASRVAVYRPGTITDGTSVHDEIIAWTEATIVAFRGVMERHLRRILGVTGP